METLASVEELYVKNLSSFPNIIWVISNRMYLPKMQVLQVDCCPGCFGKLAADLSHLLEVRSKESTVLLAWATAPLERITIRVDWIKRDGPCRAALSCESRTQLVESALQVMSTWPSLSVTNVHRDQSNKQSISLIVHALAAGTLINLAFYYPNSDSDDFMEEYCRCHSILEKMCAVVI